MRRSTMPRNRSPRSKPPRGRRAPRPPRPRSPRSPAWRRPPRRSCRTPRVSPWGSTISMATRREFLGGAAALLAAGIVPAHAATVRLMSAARIGDADGGAVWRDGALDAFKLPARGHALTRLGQAKVVVMGRRPGTFGAIVDANDPAAPAVIFAPAQGNRFAG